MIEPEREVVLNPRTRVRVETLRSFLLGLKALIENGCQIKSAHLRAMAAAGKAKQHTIGRRRKAAADGAETRTTERKKGKPGRPKKHRKKKGETEADYERRLARKRSQDYRDRKKKGPTP